MAAQSAVQEIIHVDSRIRGVGGSPSPSQKLGPFKSPLLLCEVGKEQKLRRGHIRLLPPVRQRTHTHTHTHTHTQVSLSILTARGGVLGSGLELRQPRPSGLRLDGANDPFETRLVRGSWVEFELGFETGVVLWSNPASLVQVCLFGQKRGAERGATFEGRGVQRCTAARNVRGGKTIVSHR